MTHSTPRSVPLALATLFILTLLPAPAHSQDRRYPSQLLTVDPYGFAMGRVTADAEFCDSKPSVDGWSFGCHVTAGLSVSGAAHHRPADSSASRHHADVDAVLRIRPQRLSGGWVGFRTGLTYADRHGLRPSVGAETGLSWLIDRRLYLGASVAVRTVFLLDDASDLGYNPTFRLATGFAF